MDTSHPLIAALSDRYRVERELGAGGMATVYLAQGRMQANVSLWGSYTEEWTAANLIQQAVLEPAYVASRGRGQLDCREAA